MATKTSNRKLSLPKTIKATRITSHICLVLDRSGSMQNHKDITVDSINEQIQAIKEQARTSKIATRVSLLTFSTQVDPFTISSSTVGKLNELDKKDYNPDGMTALLDAVKTAITHLQATSANETNPSYLINIFTDGLENNSQVAPAQVKKMIDIMTKTGRWTFAVNGPMGCRETFDKLLGIGTQNIQEWHTSTVGTRKMSANNVRGLQTYYAAASVGATNVAQTGFFADTTALNTKTLKSQLHDVTDLFYTYHVRVDQRIDEFVQSKLRHYTPGKGYYQLQKKVKVQGYKEIVIREKSTGKLYTGDNVRDLLKLPDGGTIELNPSFDYRYDIFILSTSINRKLLAGTDLLYLKQ